MKKETAPLPGELRRCCSQFFLFREDFELVQPFPEFSKADPCVGDADVEILLTGNRPSKMSAGAERYAGRMQDVLAKGFIIGVTLISHKAGHVWKKIECGIGAETANTGDRV